ncbi:MAG: trypsin-like peptidase domain-containing protein [Bdellovibrionales bacterium]|nr:trypsin-like peptidase domain-containing protein [Bdellovibrionales bacterium]
MKFLKPKRQRFCSLTSLFIALCFCSQTAFSSMGGTPIDDKLLQKYPILNNLIEINSRGQLGTGLYLGQGRILTAAHVFITSGAGRNNIEAILSVHRNDHFFLNENQYDLLLDPTEGSYIMKNGDRWVSQLVRDIAIIQLKDPDLISQFEKAGNFVAFSSEQKGQGGTSGLDIISAGLNWPHGYALSLQEIFSGRTVENRFSLTFSKIHAFGTDKDYGSEKIILTAPNDGAVTMGGDSGGPAFKYNSTTGQLQLIAVHYGHKPKVENEKELTEFTIEQIINWDDLDLMIPISSPNWSSYAKKITADEIANWDPRIFEHLLGALSKTMITYKHNPQQAINAFKDILDQQFLWTLTDTELAAFTKVFLWNRSKQSPGTEIREGLRKFLATTPPESNCKSLLSPSAG